MFKACILMTRSGSTMNVRLELGMTSSFLIQVTGKLWYHLSQDWILRGRMGLKRNKMSLVWGAPHVNIQQKVEKVG